MPSPPPVTNRCRFPRKTTALGAADVVPPPGTSAQPLHPSASAAAEAPVGCVSRTGLTPAAAPEIPWRERSANATLTTAAGRRIGDLLGDWAGPPLWSLTIRAA